MTPRDDGNWRAEDAAAVLREDGAMAALVDRHGVLDVDPAEDPFERLVVSILRQQVSMASAAATRERLFDAVEVTPEGILAADPGVLRDAGLSRQKTRYVRNVAEAFLEEGYDRAYFRGMDDGAVVDELTSITGVGEWTANMQLIFTFRRPDVFPVGDLGVRDGMATLFGFEREDRRAMVDRAEAWRPYRTLATLYLWRVTEDLAESVDEVTGDP